MAPAASAAAWIASSTSVGEASGTREATSPVNLSITRRSVFGVLGRFARKRG